jgi:UDPglucose 6-dehydrogenase
MERVREMLGDPKGKTIGLLGLTFKPNTDDMREAPSLEIARRLMKNDVLVRAYDPVGMERAQVIMPELIMAEDPYALAEGCDALIVCTDWNEFKHLDLSRVFQAMRQPVIVDGRNIYDPIELKRLGFQYRGVGRGYGPDGTPIEEASPNAEVNEA